MRAKMQASGICPTTDIMNEYFAEILDENQSKKIEYHLKGCVYCQVDYREFRYNSKEIKSASLRKYSPEFLQTLESIYLDRYRKGFSRC